MRYLSIKNLDKHQHYKDRRPPWIKLHAALFDDYAFQCLQDASKAHLMLLWLLASQMDNHIPYDLPFITRRLGITSPVDMEELILQGFISVSQDDGKTLAPRKQSAMPETETETEEKTETETAKPLRGSSPRAPKALSENELTVLTHYYSLHPLLRVDDKAAKRVIGTGLKTFTVGELCQALDGNAHDSWHVERKKHELSYILRNSEKISGFIAMAKPVLLNGDVEITEYLRGRGVPL